MIEDPTDTATRCRHRGGRRDGRCTASACVGSAHAHRLAATEPRTTVRRGRLAAARTCLLLGVVCAIGSAVAGLPVVRLLIGDPTEGGDLDLTAPMVWALVCGALLVAGNVIVAVEFDRVDWEWQLEDLL